MNTIRTFVIVPSLPEQLEPLRQLAYNVWWAWNAPATELFRRLDSDLWERTGHNPIALLGQISQQRLEQAARDDAYTAALYRVMDSFYVYMKGRTWFDERYPQQRGETIAYFSAEFGLHESMPIYSGGLGVLAGDHLKSASDLGIPLVGVGPMYRQGYFDQQITQDGRQLEFYKTYDFHAWPATPVAGGDGMPVQIDVRLGEQTLHARIWRVNVGRVRLFLLDADVPDNPPELRVITSRLYGGDSEMRIRQEILLGVGGMRALRAMNINPAVSHMNEGHAAFLAVERVRQTMVDQRMSFAEAREAVTAGNLFTTHTPVPAGIDRFEPDLFEANFGWMAAELGISLGELLALGRENPAQADETFCMAILALRLARRSNGVSKLHGEVSRAMWKHCWPDVPPQEVPITHVTNGIHIRSWLSAPMAELFDQYLGPNWAEDPQAAERWKRVEDIPDAELWRVHERRRERLIAVIRNRLREQCLRRGSPPAEIKAADEVLDPKALTIGFARRFAPYKRATLLFRNPDRLAALLRDGERPVQFVYSGKAHPKDGAGKDLVSEIAEACKAPEFRRRIVLLENYDINVARELVTGVDVWLNNPLRPHEASGTSGMKVPANGGLHLSCLDGWWPEAYDGENGWTIGDGLLYDDREYQDHVESEALYNLLEREVVPMFYERTVDGLPRRWIRRVKAAMRTICPVFSTHRMLREYAERLYVPTLKRYHRIAADGFAVARGLRDWKERMRREWGGVRFVEVLADQHAVLKVGDRMPLTARVALGGVPPAEVVVEAFYGPLGPSGEITHGEFAPMAHVREDDGGTHVFEGAIPCSVSGRHGYAIRVAPHHADLEDRHETGLAVWG
jgi:starch phosphorylase